MSTDQQISQNNESQENNTEKVTCVVKWFNSRNGYGFITNLDSDNDYFTHQSNLEPQINCFKTLYQGEYIECNVQKDSETGKEQAINVTGIRGGKLMCEHRASYNKNPSDNYSNNYEKRNRYDYN